MTHNAPDYYVYDAHEVLGERTDQVTRELARFISASTWRVMLDHSHPTSRDSRHHSYLRRTEGLIDLSTHLSPAGLSVDARQAVESVYISTASRLGIFLGKEVLPLQTKHAAIGHTLKPGDEPGEAHVDYYPSATWYLETPNKGGELVVAAYSDAQNIDEINNNSVIITPKPYQVIMADGQSFPHYAQSVASSEARDRISVNFSFGDPDRPPELGTENYIRGIA